MLCYFIILCINNYKNNKLLKLKNNYLEKVNQ